MTTTPGPPATVTGGRLRIPAVVLVVIYAALLLCIPSRLVVGAIGAAGTPANLCGLAALIWWACATLGGQNTRGHSPVRTAISVAAVAVLLSYAAAMLHGWYAPPSVRQVTDELYELVPATVGEITEKMMSAADRGLLTFAGWVGIVLLTVDGIRSWKDLELLVTWMTWFAGFVAVLGIVQFFTGFDIAGLFRIPGLVANSDFGVVDSRSVLRRVSGTAIHPIEFGVVMAGMFPLALHRALFRRRSVSVWVPVILIGVAMPMSVSRSVILTLGVVLLLLAIGWPSAWRWRALLLIPVAVVALRVAVPGLVGTMISLFTNLFADPSITGRTDDYGVVFGLYADNPLLGRGLFTFIPRYYRILDNQFIMILIELGAVGLVAVVTLFVVGFFTARGARRRSTTAVTRHLPLAISASLAGVFVSYATFDAWGFPMAAGFSFLLLGMAGATWQVAVAEQVVSDRPPADPPTPAVVPGATGQR